MEKALPTTLQRFETLTSVVRSHLRDAITRGDLAPGIVGTLSLLVYPMPSHVLSLFEDVVVDAAARGRGVGEALVRKGLRLAAATGSEQTDLLSGNHRQTAIRLYQRLGFRRFETNVFRYRHHPPLAGPAGTGAS